MTAETATAATPTNTLELEPAITGRAALEVVGEEAALLWVELVPALVVVTIVELGPAEVAGVDEAGVLVAGVLAAGLVAPPAPLVGAYIKLDSVALKVPVIPWIVNLAEKPSQGTPLT